MTTRLLVQVLDAEERDWDEDLDLGVISKLIIIETEEMKAQEKCAVLIWREGQGQNCYR